MAHYADVLTIIERLMKEKEIVIMAIDGRCASGKTSLANLIQEQFSCNVFHMDDYLLPFEKRTIEQQSKPGGHLDCERVLAEVIIPIKRKEPVGYHPYSCRMNALGDVQWIEPKQLNIVEGAYSLHPILNAYYDWKIFMTNDRNAQQSRVIKRNGLEDSQNFFLKWIPLEEKYLLECQIENQCDLIIDTSSFW